MSKNTKQLNISVPTDMFDWLEKSENKRRINRSQLFQKAVNKLRYPQRQKIKPMDYLIMTMGLAFGLGCISASVTLAFTFLFKTTLLMIGAVVLLASLATIIKEAKKFNATRIHR